jgi:hypothetical protein
LGAKQGLTETDLKKILDGLSGVDEVAFSVRNYQIAVMVTGHATDSGLPPAEAGMKAVPVSGSSMLIGQTDAVDQALQRIATKRPPDEVMRLAEERQSHSEFWVSGTAALVGPQATSAGIKRFSLMVSLRNRLTTDVALEFNAAPNATALKTWQSTLGAATLEGNTVHFRTSMEAEEVQQKFGQIAASPIGQYLGALVAAARYLPLTDAAAAKPAKPTIYGLDDPKQ